MSPYVLQKENTMKKALYIMMMVAASVSCSKNEVIDTAGEAISFGNIFVDKSTKTLADHTTASLDQFYVYGNVTGNVDDGRGFNTVNIYKQDKVYKEDNVWKCNTIQYWIPECTYDFVAISDVEATDPTTEGHKVVVMTTDGLPSSIKYDASSQKDVLYASIKDITTDVTGTPSTGVTDGQINPVSFTFAHMLSKVQFTFTNDFPENSGVELTVTDVKITNAAKTGTYTIGSTPKWEVNSWFLTADDGLSFGNTDAIAAGGNSGASSGMCVLIPCTQSFNITFTIKHNKGGSDTHKTITTGEITLEKGHFYNFTANLNSSNVEGVVPISFIITDTSWQSEGDATIKY